MNQPNFKISTGLVDTLRKARQVVALTGAGISAESGVPTFRDAQTGLWARFRPEQLATPQAFQRDPRLVWEWYVWRRELIAHAEPNPGHLALVEIERQVPCFTLITQNVDGLHQRAGSHNVIELHGNIQRTRCWDEEILIDSYAHEGELPPHCPQCGGLLRPDVVFFGENLPADALQAAWQAAQTADVFLSIGTSSMVEPAASLPFVAKGQKAVIIEVNPCETPLTSSADFLLAGQSGIVLPALVQAVWG